MRHECGNCLPVGGFCVNGVSDEICHALHNAYSHGILDAHLAVQAKNASSEEILETIKKVIALHERELEERSSFDKNEIVKNIQEDENKQNTPRLYTKEELKTVADVVFMEIKGKDICPGIVDREKTNTQNLWVVYQIDDYGKTPWKEFAREWRCWNVKPTEKQRRSEPWQK